MSFSIFKKISTFTAGIAALSSFGAAAPVNAQGDLLVAPTRVILDGRRGTEVILSNIGTEEATYRISLELRRMENDGRLVAIEKEDSNATEEAALGMIRYAPRRITLPPGQPQAVRLAARPGADLPDGEYRVHMSFTAIPKPRSIDEAQADAGGVSIQLIPIYGITIPIIVRHGQVTAQTTFSQPQLVQTENGHQLVLTLTRTGDSSTYGELLMSKPGMDKPVPLLRGVAIYPEVTTREVRINLTPEQAQEIAGPVRFEYREMPEAGGGLIAAVDGVLGG